ncbi:hypothetical protein RLDS_15460 [Sphingobium lactosutens DS20]|uniref:Uncharacterized protein n=1 Tax=Sphingobium lactosutens DS20 TaxID=1331060 RepID=T0IVG7_9SPHN|nr:hypothetical protein RLDS_15460 [Sphingobium lactosutens DS20]
MPICVEGLWIKQGRNQWMIGWSFLLPTDRILIHNPPTGAQFHPQPVDSGDREADSDAIASIVRVNLLAIMGTAQ